MRGCCPNAGLFPSRDAQRIIKGLEAIAKDLGRGKRLPQEEDIHFAIERELIRRIGPVGGKLHTARSRNDQVALDLKLYLRDQVDLIRREIIRLQKAIVSTSPNSNMDVVMPGFTHVQHAQPVLFSHHLLAYAWMFERDKGRLADAWKRADEMPLGSAALAGTSFPIDRAYVAKLLGFARVTPNSIDTVSDRDFLVEFVVGLGAVMTHLSRTGRRADFLVVERVQHDPPAERIYLGLLDHAAEAQSRCRGNYPRRNRPHLRELDRAFDDLERPAAFV